MMQKKIIAPQSKMSVNKRIVFISASAIIALSAVVLGIFNVVKLATPMPDFQYSTTATVKHGPHYETAYQLTAAANSSLHTSTASRSQTKSKKGGTAQGALPVTVVPKTTVIDSTSTPITASLNTSPTILPIGIAAADLLPWKTQQDIDVYFQSLKDMGVSWVRIDVGWDDVQPKDATTYDWSGLDRVVATAKSYNINVLGTLAYTPVWARDGQCTGGPKCAPSNPQLFANFSGKAALRYKGTIQYWEVWNEQNIPGFWAPQPNVMQYVTLLKAVYIQVKTSNPQATVMSGGLSPAENVPNSSIAPITFIQELYANGAQNYFDAIAFHPYTYPVSPDYVANWNAWQQIKQIRSILVTQGDGIKKIWLTEYGLPTGGPGVVHEANQLKFTYGSDYMSEAVQSSFATGVLSSYVQNKDWLGPLFWYSLKDLSSNINDPENFFGILRYDGSKKPAYDVIKNAISAQ